MIEVLLIIIVIILLKSRSDKNDAKKNYTRTRGRKH